MKRYGRHRIPPSVLQDMNHKTVKALNDWKAALPPILQVDPDEPDKSMSYLPHVLLLQCVLLRSSYDVLS